MTAGEEYNETELTAEQRERLKRAGQINALARRILDTCRVSLMMSFRYLDSALFKIPFKPENLQRPLATDGMYLYYDPIKVIKQFKTDPNEVIRDYLHSLLHCILRHPFATRRYDIDAWSFACDICVEAIAVEMCGDRYPLHSDRDVRAAFKAAQGAFGAFTPARLYRVLRALDFSPYDGFGASRNSENGVVLQNELTDEEFAALRRVLLESGYLVRDDHDPWALSKKNDKQDSDDSGDEGGGDSDSDSGNDQPEVPDGSDEGPQQPDSSDMDEDGQGEQEGEPSDEQDDDDQNGPSQQGNPDEEGEETEKTVLSPDSDEDSEDDQDAEEREMQQSSGGENEDDDDSDSMLLPNGGKSDEGAEEPEYAEGSVEEISPEALLQAEREWEDISKRIEADMQSGMRARGDGAGSFLANLELANRSQVNYAEFLRRFATPGEDMRLNDDEFDYIYYTYGLSMYGNMPLVEPLEYKEQTRVREFVIAIDTSGSTSGELVRTFITRTYEILKDSESFGDKINVHIIQCDAEIESDVCIENMQDLEDYRDNLTVKGMGGTDFRPVFAYVNRLVEQKEFRDLRGLIYFTDGYGIFPNTPPDYDTAFVFIEEEGKQRRVPPWAMRVVIDEDDISEI